MPLEVATFINQLNPANPVGSDPLAQADDHLRLLKTTIKNTFPNIDAAVTVTDDVLNALPGRVTALEAGGGGGGGTGGVAIVTSLPASGTYTGETVFNSTNGIMYTWNGTAWVAVTLSTNYTPDVPEAVEVVSSLPSTAADGKVVFNTNDNKLYERVNGAWSEVVVTVNAAQEVADASITVAKFAQGIRPIEIVSSLPTTGNSEGRMVYLTTDDKIYRFTGTSFTSSLPFGDLTGTIAANQIAANTLTAAMIQAGAIGANQIAANAVSAVKIAAGAVTADKIAATAITADKIATNAITSDKISANSITSGKIAAAAIGTSQLSASAVTADKISSGAVTATKIAAATITADKIATATITAESGVIATAAVGTLQIAGNAVTQAQSIYAAPQQEVASDVPQTIISMVVTVSGTQPLLVWGSSGVVGARLGTAQDFDAFFDNNYWKFNSTDTDAVFRTMLETIPVGQTPSTVVATSDQIASLTVLGAKTVAGSFAYVFTGVPAGTYTLSIKASKASPSQLNWSARTVSLSFLETKR